MLCDYFSYGGNSSEAIRNMVFMSLFPPTHSDRSRLLIKLVSMASSTKNVPVLTATGIWMQVGWTFQLHRYMCSFCHLIQWIKFETYTWFVPKVSVQIFLYMNWQHSTSLMYIGMLVVTLAACPYLFHLDWLSQSCATAVCVWSCFLTLLRLRCRKISNNGALSNFVWNSTNLPKRHLHL